MKLSKSIVIFLFFSSFLSAFFYALYRTNGNAFKALQFALYFLAIKIGLIGPNVPLKFNQHQPNQQLVSSVNKLESPGYHPYLSVYNDYRPSGLLMDSIERSSLVPQYSYSQNAINELRAGDSRVTQAAWMLITIWMLQQQSVGFQPVNHAPRPPHIESARNLLFGKPKPDQLSCRRLSRFDSQQFEKNEGLISQNSPSYIETIQTFDGKSMDIPNKSLDHLLSKHGHRFGVNDPLAIDPNQKDTNYFERKIRTRLTPENRNQFRNNIKKFGQSKNLIPFYGVKMHDKIGDVYYCPETKRCISAIVDPVSGKRTLNKAQPVGPNQLKELTTQNRLK